jgi:anaerobic selenocysteine-containing dehydrogenase
MPDTLEIIRTTCPRDCFDTCGIAVVKRGGVIAHVRGDPHHPVSRGKLCAKCSIGYNREWRDPQARLTRPLRRVGPKGEGRFEPISWDTALTTVADRFQQIATTAGPHTIINTHYTGTISLLAFFFPMRETH